MPAHIFDFDGTLVYHHQHNAAYEHNWLPGAKEMLQDLVASGEAVLIITARNAGDDDKAWSVAKGQEFLAREGFRKIRFITGVPAHRTLYDDREALAITRPQDAPWSL